MPSKHEELIKQYEEDKKIYVYPQILWECSWKSKWYRYNIGNIPLWNDNISYRRNPDPSIDMELLKATPKKESLMIGKVSVPAPYFGDLVPGTVYYVVMPHLEQYYRPVLYGQHMSNPGPILGYQELGLLHANKRAAVNHGFALVRFTSRKSGR